MKSASFWLTKDGRTPEISKMSTAHLRNTVAYLARCGLAAALAVEQGSTDPCDVAECRMIAGHINRRAVIRYENMLNELKRRENAPLSSLRFK